MSMRVLPPAASATAYRQLQPLLTHLSGNRLTLRHFHLLRQGQIPVLRHERLMASGGPDEQLRAAGQDGKERPIPAQRQVDLGVARGQPAREDEGTRVAVADVHHPTVRLACRGFALDCLLRGDLVDALPPVGPCDAESDAHRQTEHGDSNTAGRSEASLLMINADDVGRRHLIHASAQ